MSSVAQKSAEMEEETGILALDIGQFALDEVGNAGKALSKYHVHAAEIILVAVLRRIEAGSNHRDLREFVRGMATQLDKASQGARGRA